MCYDPERKARENGFTRDNIDSVINQVIMKAIFQVVRASDVNRLKPDLSRPKPKTLLKSNLVTSVAPAVSPQVNVGGNTGASSSSSSKGPVGTSVNASTTPKAAAKSASRTPQQLKLGTVEGNLTKHRQSAR